MMVIDAADREITRLENEVDRLRAQLAESEARVRELESALLRAAGALHANAQSWGLEGYPRNAGIADAQSREASGAIVAPEANHA